jgi:hypothetical protein
MQGRMGKDEEAMFRKLKGKHFFCDPDINGEIILK